MLTTLQLVPSRPMLTVSALAAAVALAAPALAQQAPAGGAGQQAPAQDAPRDGGNRGGDNGGRGNRAGGMFRGMGRMGIQSQIREAFEPDFVRRDVPLFKEQLSLEEAQLAVLEQLMNDYEDAFNPARDQMNEQMQSIGRQMMAPMMSPDMQEKWRGAMDEARAQMEQMAAEKGAELTQEERQQFFRAQMEKLGEEVRTEMKSSGAFDQMRASLGEMVTDFGKWQESKARMRKTFVDGLQASLNDGQQKKWPAFERFLAREKTLPRGTISGESVNLFFVLDEAGLSKETFAKLQPIMDEYELQLDAALRARNEFLAQNEGKYLAAVQAGDMEGAKRFASRSIECRERIRDVNDRYREAICAELDPADASRVRQEALAAAFERVYAQNRVQRAFEAAEKIEGLEAAVLESIKTLAGQYVTEVGPMNDRIAQAIRKEEPPRLTEDMTRVVGFLSGDVPMSQMFRPRPQDGESQELFDKRTEMNDRYMSRLEGLLTPEQFESLPKGRESGRGGQGGPGGMFGGGAGPIKLADLPEHAQERMKRFDKNNDGTIDDTERQAMMAEFRERGGPGMMFGGGGGGGGGNGGGRGGNGGGGQSPN